MNLFFDKISYFACIYDDAGRPMGRKQLDPANKTFSFMKHEFVFNANCKTFLKLPVFKGPILFGFYKFFFYNYDNPTPIELEKGCNPSKPNLNAQQLYTFVHTKKLEEMNQLADENSFLSALLKLLKSPAFWIALCAFLGFIVWLGYHHWRLW